MARSLMIAVLLATTATNVQAQTSGGPPIAYAKVAGSGQEIYLVNPDGSGLKKIYATPAKRSVAWLDLKPGGGEVAWVEAGSGSPRQIKILSLDGAGNPVGSPRALVGPCAPDTVDYHPTGPLLIISDICSQNPRIASVGTDGTGYSILVSGSAYLNKARWLRDGVSYVYVRAPVDGGPLQICRNSCDPGQNE